MGVNKYVESTANWQIVNKSLPTCQQAWKKQCEHILINSIGTHLLQVFTSCAFLLVHNSVKRGRIEYNRMACNGLQWTECIKFMKEDKMILQHRHFSNLFDCTRNNSVKSR
jgi:hypothetical protein